MKPVCIVHYHLRDGGVTRVIERQVEALLLAGIRPTLLVGEAPRRALPVEVEVIVEPTLDYCTLTGAPAEASRARLSTIKKLLQSYPKQTLFHIHNPTLGKNSLLTAALWSLAEQGRCCFFHCHDFPLERPAMMANIAAAAAVLSMDAALLRTPESSRIEYLFANRDDMQRPEFHGQSVRYLPNPVTATSDSSRSSSEILSALSLPHCERYWLYPIRAITRKNIGELLLLSLLMGDETLAMVVTLAPENQTEWENYEQWVNLSESLALPIAFDAAQRIGFEQLLGGCERVLSTSIKEGFGMAFLEPWLVGKAVVGRALPMVMADFAEAAVQFDGFYDAILLSDGRDFGLCSEEEKRAIVQSVAANQSHLNKLQRRNSASIARLQRAFSPREISENCAAVERNYSLRAFSTYLIMCYKKS